MASQKVWLTFEHRSCSVNMSTRKCLTLDLLEPQDVQTRHVCEDLGQQLEWKSLSRICHRGIRDVGRSSAVQTKKP